MTATLRDFLTPNSLDNTVNPETMDEEVTAIATFNGGTVFEMEDGGIIFAPAHALAYWNADEPNLENVLAGEVDGWEPDDDTKVTRF